MMVYAIIESFTALGLGQALMRKDKIDNTDVDTLFFVNILRGILLCVVVLILSFPVSIFMKEPNSRFLIMLMSFYPLVLGFHNPSLIILQRKLNFKKEIPYHLAGVISNLFVTLILAFCNYGAISLVIGLLTQSLVQLVLSYTISPYKPKFKYSNSSFLELFQFGQWIFLSQGLKYLSNNLPSWAIGNILGIQALGNYQMAGRTSQSIGNEFTSLVSTLAFPSFAILQGDFERLKLAYIKSQKIILSASFLLFAEMYALATPFCDIFLGKSWIGTDILIRLFALVALVQSIGAQSEILKALGYPNVIVKYSFIRLVLIFSTIYFLTTNFGSKGALFSILLPSLLIGIPTMQIILSKLKIAPFLYLKIIIPSAVAFSFVIIIQSLLVNINNPELFHFILFLCIYAVAYVIMFLLVDNIFKNETWSHWKNLYLGIISKLE